MTAVYSDYQAPDLDQFEKKTVTTLEDFFS